MELYICETYYHLLISLIKNMNNKCKNDLIISSELTNDDIIFEKVKKTSIFKNVYRFEYTKQAIENRISKIRFIKNILLIKQMKRNNFFNFYKYKKIFLFNDNELYGKYLNYYKIHYNLIEDGTDCYKNNAIYWSKQNSIKKIIKEKMFRMYELADSIYIDSIEVNDKKGVKCGSDNLIEKPKKQLFESLDSKDKNTILNIFIEDLDKEKLDRCNLLITQPLSEDGYIENEKDKIEMYKYIINKYFEKDSNIIIKTHPRETTNYKEEFKKAYIIDKPFPLELLSFYNEFRISKIITISSTSVAAMKLSEETIILGWEWFEKYKGSIKDEKKAK